MPTSKKTARPIAGMLGMPVEKVRCIHAEGAGCYGHHGADDVAADAAMFGTHPFRKVYDPESRGVIDRLGWSAIFAGLRSPRSDFSGSAARIIRLFIMLALGKDE
jgi:hypothetical protein